MLRSHYAIERSVCIFLLWMITMFVIIPSRNVPDYKTYAISDWLINYQGGFVRRGLLGELLYQLYQMHPFSVRHYIIAFDLLIFAVFGVVAYRLFRCRQWSALPLLLPFACCTLPLPFYRRDMLMLCLCVLVFFILFRGLQQHKRYLLAVADGLMALAILIYEPIFFIIVPSSALVYWSVLEGGKKRRLFCIIAHLSLPIACMALAVLAKGNTETAEVIWNSWKPLFKSYPDGSQLPSLGEGVAFMNHALSDVFLKHLDYNFLFRSHPSWDAFQHNVAWLLMFAGCYYLVAFVPSVNAVERKVTVSKSGMMLGSIFLFQCLMMLPMFTVLSCDYGRTIPYCVFAAFLLTHLCTEKNIRLLLPPPLSESIRGCGRFCRNGAA